eukprot:EG_transcript_10996
MTEGCIFISLFISLLFGLLFSHISCRHGLSSACVFVKSLPIEVQVKLSHPDIILQDSWQVGEVQSNFTDPTEISTGDQPFCTDVELNKPDGTWISRPNLPYGYRCPWIQANYGCEKAPPVPLQWLPKVAADGNCTYADHTPITAALERARKVPGKRYPLVVVFVGDSFLRQVVEAMACRFQALVTVRRIPRGKPKLPKDGPPPQHPLREHHGICTGADGRFQNPPYSTPDGPCSDDAMMLRFGKDMDVYFLFRASSTLQAVRWFNLNIPDISVVVSEPRIWTGGGGHPKFDIGQLGRWRYDGTLVLITRGEARGTYPRCLTISVIRLRDDARSDGGHVCLPGSPDDAVRLLLGMVANPTELGVKCALPPEDFQRDGGEYLPLSSRGQVRHGGPAGASMWGEGFTFVLDPRERQLYDAQHGKVEVHNKSLHDVDDWIEASYNRTRNERANP